MSELTPRFQRLIERGFKADREARELIGLVAAEFRSDPMSVQCFDSRIVQRVIDCAAEIKAVTDAKGYDL